MRIISIFLVTFMVFACTQKTVEESKSLDKMTTEELDSLVNKEPENVEYLKLFGAKLLQEYRGEEALPVLAKAYRLNPKDIRIKQLYASALINRMDKNASEVETGIAKLKEIIKKEPGNKEAFLDIATAYSYFQDYENTFKYVNEALKIDPKYRDAYTVKGRTYYKMGNMKLAKSSFETAVQQDAKFFVGYLQLGWLYTESEDYKHALEYFTTAVQLENRSTDALYGVAYSNQMLKNSDVALQDYRNLLAVDSTYHLAYFNQAYIKQYDQMQADSAVYYYKKALALQPEFVKGWHQLGMCYLDIGNKETALIAFKKALEYNPDYDLTKEVLIKNFKNYDPTK
ncbi:MAG TPA: tetratricopeptide repeat protein [Crocinitomicaceae bacterium]|nr:tetratricopeptide repeat protein [Crocinitomicaceae bacterium]